MVFTTPAKNHTATQLQFKSCLGPASEEGSVWIFFPPTSAKVLQ